MKLVVRAIITDKDGNVLLGKRARGDAVGFYALIGGKPNKNETPRQTIIREVKEETGLKFKPTLYLKKIDNHSDLENSWLVYYFTGTVSGQLNLKLDEIENAIYVSSAELDKFQIAFDHKERLKDYFKFIK